MSKTIELRKVITKLLKELNVSVFYEHATDDAKFPYMVYELNTVDFENLERDDIILTINAWDKNTSSTNIEILADKIEKLFKYINIPTSTVLPTIFITGRNAISDEDEDIQRRELRFMVQNYYIGE